jgi:hypothetical protein
MAYGDGDPIMPNSASGILAAVLKLQLVEPVFKNQQAITRVQRPVAENRAGGDGQLRTAAYIQYEEGGHWAVFESAQAQADYVAFLSTLFESGTPEIPALQ